MSICGCGSPSRCCQPAVAGHFIYADLRSELNTHLAPQALFTQSSPAPKPLLQAFPFPSTLGEVTLHQLSQASMFIYSSRGNWAFSPLLWSFPPTAAFASFPAPDCWACAAAPAFSSWHVYLQLTWEVIFSTLLWSFPPTTVLQAFPLLIAGCVLLLLLSPAWLVCLLLTWDVGLPPSPVEFSSLCHSYKLSRSWLLGGCCHSCLLRPACLFTVL
jgi:hypothetical protein